MTGSVPTPSHQTSQAQQRFEELAALYKHTFGHPCHQIAYCPPNAPTDEDYERLSAEVQQAIQTDTPHPVSKARRDRILEQLCSGTYEYNRWGENTDVQDFLTVDLTDLRDIEAHHGAVFRAIHELTTEERSKIPKQLWLWWHGDVIYSRAPGDAPVEKVKNAYPSDGRHMVKAGGGGGGYLSDEMIERLKALKRL